jgi:hypothetical protein
MKTPRGGSDEQLNEVPFEDLSCLLLMILKPKKKKEKKRLFIINP